MRVVAGPYTRVTVPLVVFGASYVVRGFGCLSQRLGNPLICAETLSGQEPSRLLLNGNVSNVRYLWVIWWRASGCNNNGGQQK